jgi:catechol 2,3-dioxygenase-like lactoylglutathione lyase family enzyme
MKVKRIVANIQAPDTEKAKAFYQDLLGLDLLMDHGWIRTYGSSTSMTVQVTIASEGGSSTEVPGLSIEVDDLSGVLSRASELGIPLEYGPVSEPWGVKRFFVRDPFGTLVNILEHN